jgi:phosphopentomutase
VLNKEIDLYRDLNKMTVTLKNLNSESMECCDLFLKESIKDQQRKILVIGKLCDLIQDQATADNDPSYDTARNISKLVKYMPPFEGVDSTSLT